MQLQDYFAIMPVNLLMDLKIILWYSNKKCVTFNSMVDHGFTTNKEDVMGRFLFFSLIFILKRA